MNFKNSLLTTLIVGTVSLQGLTLKQSVEESLTTNPIIIERLHNYRATVQDLEMANSEYLPSLDLVSSFGKEKTGQDNNDLSSDTDLSYYENSLVLLYNIFDGFSTTNKINYQKQRIIAASYNFVEKSNDIAFQMTNKYIQLLKNKALLVVMQEHVSLNTKILNKIKPLAEAGIAQESDLKKVNSALALSQANLIVQKNNLIDSLSSFASVFGRTVSISDLEIPEFNGQLPKNLRDALKYSMENNPSLLTSDYNIKASTTLLKQRKKDYYPKIDFKAEQNIDNNVNGVEEDRNKFRAGIVLSYNLYKGGSNSANVQKHRSSVHKEIQIRESLKRDVIEGLKLSWSAKEMLKLQLGYLQTTNDSNEEVLKLYHGEYDIGSKTLLDILSAQDALISSKSQIIKSNYELLFAKYRIMDSMGTLISTVMGKNYNNINKMGLTSSKEDLLPVIFDQDNDNIVDSADMCSNSNPKTLDQVLLNGCENKSDKYSKIIHFKPLIHDGDELTHDSKEYLEKIKQTIKDSKKSIVKVVISGHLDETNDIAIGVKKYLQFTGIQSKKIIVKDNSTSHILSTDEDLNKRIEIVSFIKSK